MEFLVVQWLRIHWLRSSCCGATNPHADQRKPTHPNEDPQPKGKKGSTDYSSVNAKSNHCENHFLKVKGPKSEWEKEIACFLINYVFASSERVKVRKEETKIRRIKAYSDLWFPWPATSTQRLPHAAV